MLIDHEKSASYKVRWCLLFVLFVPIIASVLQTYFYPETMFWVDLWRTIITSSVLFIIFYYVVIVANNILEQRERFFNMIAHDLKNPLSAIRMTVDLIQSDSSLITPTMIDRISRNALILNGLIDDLVNVARLSIDKLPLDKELVDMNTLVDGVLSTHSMFAKNKGIIITAEIEWHQCFCDGIKIARVIDNLVGNAIKFTPKGGTIRVHAKHIDGISYFDVQDSGPGISPKDIATIFEPYHQIKGPEMRVGLGLGLSIAKGFVVAHHGQIWVDSKLGEGSKFCFTIPNVQDHSE